jgi:hypothetical protein
MIKHETINKTIGKTFADKLNEIIIDSGGISFSRREMVEDLQCANFLAAARLSKVLRKLKITTPAHLNRTDPFSLLRTRGVGESTVFVAMCILDANGFSVEKWWGWKDTNVLKFSSFKHHASVKARKHKQEVA